jgi:molecular chaperone IbpA
MEIKTMNTYLNSASIPALFKNFDKLTIGFEEQYNRLADIQAKIAKGIPTYPPFNVYKVDDNKYRIEVAVAGFSKNNLDITLDKDSLIIKGFHTDDNTSEEQDAIYKGIANRPFTHMFALSDHVVVHNAELVNGLLKVYLESIIPEEKKPKKVSIKE